MEREIGFELTSKIRVMSAHFITRYWEQEQRVFVKNSRVLRLGHNPEALHDLRVAVKKLRAALEAYIQLTAEPFWDNPLSETEKLFATVGRLRDVEICRELLREHRQQAGETFPAFEALLKNRYQASLRWASEALATYRPREIEKIGGFLKSEDEALCRQHPATRLELLIREAWKQLPSLYRQPHALRKQLKTLYYWMKMLPEEKSLQERAGHLSPWLDQLGAWQDRMVLIRRIRHFRKDFLPKTFQEHEALRQLIGVLTAANRTALHAVIQQLKKTDL